MLDKYIQCNPVYKILFPSDDARFIFHKKIQFPALAVPHVFRPTSCTPTKYNLHLASSVATAASGSAIQARYIPSTKSHIPYPPCSMFQWTSPGPRHVFPFHNKTTFYCKVFLAPRPPPKLEDKTLSAHRDCLFNIFTAILHIVSRLSVRMVRTHYAVVPRTNVADNYNLRYASCIA